MEIRAHYVLVGAFLLGLVAAAFGFVVWLTGTQATDTTTYKIEFQGSVTGLQEGGVVRFRGIPVGAVTRVRIDPNNSEQVEVLIEVDESTPVKTDTVARLELQGITGVSYIQLTGGSKEAPLLASDSRDDIPVIQSEPSSLEKVFESVPQLLEELTLVAQGAKELLSEQNRQAISDTFQNVNTLTQTLVDRIDEIDRILASTGQTMASANDTMVAAKETVVMAQGVIQDFRPAVKDMSGTLQSFRSMSGQLEALIAENRRPLQDFSASGLYELSQFIAEARSLVSSLTRLTGRIENDPAYFIFGNTQKGYEPQ